MAAAEAAAVRDAGGGLPAGFFAAAGGGGITGSLGAGELDEVSLPGILLADLNRGDAAAGGDFPAVAGAAFRIGPADVARGDFRGRALCFACPL